MSVHVAYEQKQAEPPVKPKHWWQGTRAKRVLGIVLVVALLGGVLWRVKYYPYVSTNDARVAMDVIHLAPAAAGGRIVQVHVQEGDQVSAGQVVVELDHRTPQAQVDLAKAHLTYAEKELQRLQHLVAKKSASEHDLDSATASYDAAKAELALAQITLDATYIKSPINGVVIQQLAKVGNILAPGQTATTVVDVDHAWVSANIQETSVRELQPGQPVTIHVDEGGDYTGTVSDILATPAAQSALIPSDNAAGNFTKLVQRIPTKVVLDPGQDAHLRVGQSVEIKVQVH